MHFLWFYEVLILFVISGRLVPIESINTLDQLMLCVSKFPSFLRTEGGVGRKGGVLWKRKRTWLPTNQRRPRPRYRLTTGSVDRKLHQLDIYDRCDRHLRSDGEEGLSYWNFYLSIWQNCANYFVCFYVNKFFGPRICLTKELE